MDMMPYYGLVVTLARRVHLRLTGAGVAIELDDLIQEGALGLLAAARRFDADRGLDFSTFAYPRIRGAIEDYLRRLDPLSQRQRSEVRDVAEARRRRGQELGREPSADEIAVGLGGDTSRVDRAARLADLVRHALDPLDTVDDLATSTAAPDAALRQQLGADVEHCLEHAVTQEERRTVLLRFWRHLTLARVARLLGRPLQTIYHVERRARDKLRECLAARGWEVADLEDVV